MQKISVIIPCYNYAHFLPEALNSLIYQTYSNWECLIINDGSIDNTEEVSLKYCKKDSRIKYYFKPNGGLSSARNFGLIHASGQYIQFLDADDLIKPSKFSQQIEVFNKNHNILVCYSNFEYFDNDSKSIITKGKNRRLQIIGNAYEDFLFNWGSGVLNIPIHCPLINNNFLKANNIRFNENLKAVEDWVFWLEIARHDAKFYFIDEELAIYRRHISSMVQDREKIIYNYILAVFYVFNSIEEKYKQPFLELFAHSISSNLVKENKKIDELKGAIIYKTGEFIILPLIKIKKMLKNIYNFRSLC